MEEENDDWNDWEDEDNFWEYYASDEFWGVFPEESYEEDSVEDWEIKPTDFSSYDNELGRTGIEPEERTKYSAS